MRDYISYYDDQNYRQSFLMVLSSFTKESSPSNIVYLIKNIIAQDNFQVNSKEQLRKLVFYYFYTLWEVRFTNDYCIYFKKDILDMKLFSFVTIEENEKYSNFQQYFDLWKNVVFLNKVIDTTIEKHLEWIKKNAIEVSTIIDFFIVILHENFELYTLEWEHFPLFKWLIWELSLEENDQYHRNYARYCSLAILWSQMYNVFKYFRL